jgi:Protein of unknown function (DUF3866)
MPVGLRRGTVTAVTARHEELLRLEVDAIPCIAFPRLTGAVEVGDDVVVNDQARTLELGSGGFDILVVNLTRGLGLDPEPGAHVMALPYTPAQFATIFSEEASGGTPTDLNGTPVVCCGLHSQVVPVCAALRGLRVVYVQLAGGALPVALSDALRVLRGEGLLTATIAASPCVDADVTCVSITSALTTASGLGAEVIVCGIGPGMVGTGTFLGHGGLAVTEAANAAAALGGRVVIAPRVSFADLRERHQGLSHHTRAALGLCLAPVAVAWPSGLAVPDEVAVEVVDVGEWLDACAGLPLDHMGRGVDADPWFFAAAFAAGQLARSTI